MDTQAADVDELLGLCSGRFIGDDASQVPQKSHVMTQESTARHAVGLAKSSHSRLCV
jgi:hypothetical protein